MNKKDFNGYSFNEPKQRKVMRYLVIRHGDLDVNNAYAFQSKKDLNKYLNGNYTREIFAVFKIKDITP